ncbi:response regulator transcription factor [Streptomyces sp. OR43]|uniref:response regulator transcription factor n=1 Tax=Streptomyces sp. or43 TaxID=2478957 RepID=UPI0011CDF4F7|nr:response regulator transcription factor [Streptomyces sp. or43]TXS39163.1 DNA-binding response regulator [Streptomyces sp. or43]
MDVVVASRNMLLLEGLCRLLRDEEDMRIVGAAGTAERALSMVAAEGPDIVVVSSDLGDVAVAAIPERVRAAGSGTRVVVTGAEISPPHVLELVRLGISAYLPVSATHEELKAAMRSVVADSDRVTISLTRDEVRRIYGSEQGSLTRLEVDILGMVAAAMTNGQIASRLSLSEATVKRHLRKIFRRLGAVSRLDAVNKASDAHILV